MRLRSAIIVSVCLLAGCIDPLFKASPRSVGVTNIGNVPAHLRSGDAKSEAKPTVAPGAVKDEMPASPPAAKPVVATTGTANNPLYGLILIGSTLAVGGGIALAIVLSKRRKASKPKPPTP